MFTLSNSNTFQLYTEPTDMRKSFNSLSGIISNFTQDGLNRTTVFIFINRRRDKIKLLHWVGSGYLLYYKRLEEGSFELPRYDISQGLIKLSYVQMVMLIDGISIVNIDKRKRYLSPIDSE